MMEDAFGTCARLRIGEKTKFSLRELPSFSGAKKAFVEESLNKDPSISVAKLYRKLTSYADPFLTVLAP